MRLGLKKAGSVAYCSLIGQIVFFLQFFITIVCHITGLVFFYVDCYEYFRQILGRYNYNLMIARLASDSYNYSDTRINILK